MTDPVVAAVCRQLTERSEAGQAKYGTTLARTDLTVGQWIQHAQEEALDLACYLERLKAHAEEIDAAAADPDMIIPHDGPAIWSWTDATGKVRVSGTVHEWACPAGCDLLVHDYADLKTAVVAFGAAVANAMVAAKGGG